MGWGFVGVSMGLGSEEVGFFWLQFQRLSGESFGLRGVFWLEILELRGGTGLFCFYLCVRIQLCRSCFLLVVEGKVGFGRLGQVRRLFCSRSFVCWYVEIKYLQVIMVNRELCGFLEQVVIGFYFYVFRGQQSIDFYLLG